MQSSNKIEHSGLVTQIDDSHVYINIVAESACSSCHAKGACSAGDVADKIIEVQRTDVDFQIGERVKVAVTQHLGFKALLLAYVYPFLVLMVVLIAVQQLSQNELIAGISALVILLPYYAVLYFFRNKLSRTFIFSAQKIDQENPVFHKASFSNA